MSTLKTETPESVGPLPSPDKETALKQHQMIVDLYKFYFEMVLKFLIFYYAVTGAILSFYLSQPNVGFMRYALTLPIFLSVVFSIFSFSGAYRVGPLRDEILRVTRILGSKLYPDTAFLKYMLNVAGLLFFAIAVGLFVVSWAR